MCSDLWEREVITFHMRRKFAPHSAAAGESSGGPDFRSIARTTHSPSGPSRHGLIRVGTQPPQNTPLALLSSHHPIPLTFPRKRASVRPDEHPKRVHRPLTSTSKKRGRSPTIWAHSRIVDGERIPTHLTNFKFAMRAAPCVP